jgi:hypothetical protein
MSVLLYAAGLFYISELDPTNSDSSGLPLHVRFLCGTPYFDTSEDEYFIYIYIHIAKLLPFLRPVGDVTLWQ